MENQRELFFYKEYFRDFYLQQTPKIKRKILWTLQIVEEIEKIPETYFRHLEDTDALYEIRVQVASNVFRIFSFFDENNLAVAGHGFQKKTRKTPVAEIKKAEKIKSEYYEEKKLNKPQRIY